MIRSAFVLLMIGAPLLFAEESKVAKDLKEKSYCMLMIGCRLADFAKETGATTPGPAGKASDGKVYLLTGRVTPHYKKGGEWPVAGKLSADGKTIVVEKMGKHEFE